MRALGHLHDRNPQEALAAARAFGWLMAAELRALDIDLSFAPVVDLDLGMAEVIGDRALHPTPAVVSALSAEFSAGANAAGMAMTAKHFPTHGGARADSHTALAADDRELDQLTDDLDPYRHLIANGLESVMVGHVIFRSVDPLPASLSPFWMREQLRGWLGFDGAVLSDDMSMAGADIGGDCRQRIIRSLEGRMRHGAAVQHAGGDPRSYRSAGGLLQPGIRAAPGEPARGRAAILERVARLGSVACCSQTTRVACHGVALD